MDWAQILVILLTVILVVFLILAAILTVLLIKLTHQIKSVASSAQKTVSSIETSASRLRKGVAPLVFISSVIKRRQARKDSHHEEG